MPTASVFAALTKSKSVEGAALVSKLVAPDAVGVSNGGFTVSGGVQTPTTPGPEFGIIPAPQLAACDWTLPDPYVTGGIAPPASAFGLSTILALVAVTVTLPIDGTVTAGLSSADPTKVWVGVEDNVSGVSAEHAASSATGIKLRVVAIGF